MDTRHTTIAPTRVMGCIWSLLLLLLLLLPHLAMSFTNGSGARADSIFAALKSDGSVVAWGTIQSDDYEGNIDTTGIAGLDANVASIASTWSAFAALKSDGIVVAWGLSGGDTTGVSSQLVNVISIASTGSAFAALKSDGTVVAWGNPDAGGDGAAVSSQLTDVKAIYASNSAFAALKGDGSVVTWGSTNFGGSTTDPIDSATSLTSGVISVYSNLWAFAALKSDGSVVAWGKGENGGDAAGVSSQLTDVVSIYSTVAAFAAIKSDGTVVTWGDESFGGDSSEVNSQLVNVINIYSTAIAFAALKNDGTVITWGNSGAGGDSSGVSLTNVVSICSTQSAFAALTSDATVVTWGDAGLGGDSSGVSSMLENVKSISSTGYAFAARKSDGTVVTWGDAGLGGDSSGVSSQLENVKAIYSNGGAFAALTSNGAVVAWKLEDYGGSTSSPIDVASDLTSGVVSIAGQAVRSTQFYTPTMPYPVQPGSGRAQVFYDATGMRKLAAIIFSSVTTKGTTTVTPLLAASPGYAALPAGFLPLTPPVHYDMATTITYSGAIQVCLWYIFPVAGTPCILQYKDAAWTDVTTSIDTQEGKVCGEASSLSPFTLATAVPTPSPTSSSTLAPTITVTAPVPTGSNVQQELPTVNGDTVTMTFSSVTGAGVTTVQTVAEGSPAFVPLPSSFSLGDPPIYYEITTTATFSGPLEICLSYAVETAGGDAPRLLHYTNNEWEDVTTSVNTQEGIVCGQVSSLSPLALGFSNNPISCLPSTALRLGPRINRRFVHGTSGKSVTVMYMLSVKGTFKGLNATDMGVQVTLPAGATVKGVRPSSGKGQKAGGARVTVGASSVTWYPLTLKGTRMRAFKVKAVLSPPFNPSAGPLRFRGELFQQTSGLCPLPAGDVVVSIKYP
jgi:alpha-tubulin suppressor-like RCC1 family protein